MITNCTHCGAQYQLPDKMLGKQARCKACKRLFVIVPCEDEVELPEPTGSTASTMTPVHDEVDGLDALASAASGADFDMAPRSAPSRSRPAPRQHEEHYEEDDRRPRKYAKGARAALGMGITSCCVTLLGLIAMIIAMVTGKNTSLLVAFGLVSIGLLSIGAIFSMMAVVNGTSAMGKIKKARHPLGGRGEASTGSILGAIALCVVFICAITIGIYLARTGGIKFKKEIIEPASVNQPVEAFC